jgi:8-oxo-dGTP diphosphatase
MESTKMSYTYQYPMQSVTADCVVFVGDEVLLVKRNKDPFKGCWALPGGHLDPEDENTKVAADRELKEETGVSADQALSGQVGAYSQIDRDPRGRYVTVAYYYILKEKPELTIQEDEVKEACWFKFFDLKREQIAFDHYRIIRDANIKTIGRKTIGRKTT